MQIKKEEVFQSILNHAFDEFSEKGFLRSSMRSIADRGGFCLSNIYNYFKTKDILFREVLKHILLSIDYYMDYIRPDHYPDIFHCDLKEHIRIIRYLADYIHQNRKMLELLLFKSAGSTLENHKDYIIERYTETCLEYSKIISVNETGKEYVVSGFVAHNIAGTWANFVIESLMHSLTLEEIIQYASEMMTFMYNGWSGLMKSHG